MDPAIEDLINSINFELEPIYVIRLCNEEFKYFLKEMEFVITSDNLIRTRFWTDNTTDALHFHSYDEVSNFIKHQLIGTPVLIKEIL